jgi:photosystem II stability/assembly factor-like uncharacterized protein
MYPLMRSGEPLLGWLDTAHGWAVAGTGLRWTSDGGATWSEGAPLPASGMIQFVDQQHGWLTVSGNSELVGPYVRQPLYRTTDGGRTWTPTELPASSSRGYRTWAHFSDLDHGLLVRCPSPSTGDYAVCESFTTDDGGVTFQGPGSRRYPTAIFWLSPTLGWGVEDRGFAWEVDLTRDGGRTWTSWRLGEGRDFGGSYMPLAMELDQAGKGRLLVEVNPANAPLILARFETADGGQTWTLAWHGTTPEMLNVTRRAGDRLIGVGEYLWWSGDFGVTWHKLSKRPGRDVEFTDASTGWAVTEPVSNPYPADLLVSHDGGASWITVLSGPTNVLNP